jgi:hypothetical protein
MRDWSRALETAFEASLKKDGCTGNFGNRLEKARHLKVQATTQVAHSDHRAKSNW